MRYSISPTESREFPDTFPENFPQMAQGVMKLATDADIIIDNTGVTGPNLHRRLDSDNEEIEEPMIAPNTYTIGVYSTNSFRTIDHKYHDEDSTTSEVP